MTVNAYPYISIDGPTSRIKINVTGIDALFDQGAFRVYAMEDGGEEWFTVLQNQYSSHYEGIIPRDFKPGTLYHIYVGKLTSSAIDAGPSDVVTCPARFSWPSDMKQGADIRTLTAAAWNSFCERINQYYMYFSVNISHKKYSISFQSVSRDDIITANTVNLARDAMIKMKDRVLAGGVSIQPPDAVNYGDIIKYKWFDDMAKSLNSCLYSS